MRAWCLFLAAAFALFVAGCHWVPFPYGPTDPDLVGPSWQLERIERPDSALVAKELDRPGSLSFSRRSSESNGDMLVLGGRAACNYYTGAYRAEDGELEVRVRVQTLMRCSEAAMGVEAAMLEALEEASNYRVEEEMLHVRSEERGTLIFRSH